MLTDKKQQQGMLYLGEALNNLLQEQNSQTDALSASVADSMIQHKEKLVGTSETKSNFLRLSRRDYYRKLQEAAKMMYARLNQLKKEEGVK